MTGGIHRAGPDFSIGNKRFYGSRKGAI